MPKKYFRKFLPSHESVRGNGSNPFTIVPLYYLAYKIGTLVTGDVSAASAPPPFGLRLDHVSDWMPMLMSWINAMGKPFVVGLCTLGAALWAGSYFAVRGAWRLYIVTVWRQRQRARRGAIGQASHK